MRKTKVKSSLFPTTSNFMSPTRHNGTFTQELDKNVEGSEHHHQTETDSNAPLTGLVLTIHIVVSY